MSEETPDAQPEESLDDWGSAMDEQGGSIEDQSIAELETTAAVDTSASDANDQEDYEKAAFKDLNDSSSQLAAVDANLDVILDIPVTLSMEIGRTELPIRSLLQLNQGSVVELDRLAGEPMDVLINGTLIAHGEVVVINEKFGIRLTDVISPAERVKKLK